MGEGKRVGAQILKALLVQSRNGIRFQLRGGGTGLTGKQLYPSTSLPVPLCFSLIIPISWSRNENRLRIWLEACCDSNQKWLPWP